MKPIFFKPGKVFMGFAVIAALALPVILFKAWTLDLGEADARAETQAVPEFDHNAKQLFGMFNQTTPAYMDGTSTERTLDYYYSLRQYPGSPPVIPHEMTDAKGEEYVCLSCHEKGGFAVQMNRFTPVTPHPQHTYCGQCHVKKEDMALFRESDWASVRPPKLGLSALPGSPPPIAHAIQMRENCIACHVGPGTVVPIRVEHPMRGNCRQCHVPAETAELFTRKPGQ
jgi:cytochrome c-type protein NapB